MLKVILIILALVSSYIFGVLGTYYLVNHTWYAGELYLNSTDLDEEPVKFALNNNPLNYAKQRYVVFRVIDTSDSIEIIDDTHK